MTPRRLDFLPLEIYVDDDGNLRQLRNPDGHPTIRQLATLNRLGCLYLVEPGEARPLTCSDVAGAIDAALDLEPGERPA